MIRADSKVEKGLGLRVAEPRVELGVEYLKSCLLQWTRGIVKSGEKNKK